MNPSDDGHQHGLAHPGAVRQFPPLAIGDDGRVRLPSRDGAVRSAFITDSGKTRLGGQGPIFRASANLAKSSGGK